MSGARYIYIYVLVFRANNKKVYKEGNELLFFSLELALCNRVPRFFKMASISRQHFYF